ncbi:MAG: hypothetical protein ACPGVU_02650 [Limisphaerales bacterium]
MNQSRRTFLKSTGALIAGGAIANGAASYFTRQDAPYAEQDPSVTVLNPRGRVPLSFIIDDSTCLVNMGHYCSPQFGAAFPDRDVYKKDWKSWPREIPDAFVREFGEWCADNGVKGKYSIVPNPACVGWLDRELPGWSRRELKDSLKLVRELMVPNWDIHPEMITHTRVIDIRTGRPFPGVGAHNIENSWPREKKSVDEIAAYIAYALQILKNCDLPCEGVTTPGGMGNVVKSELSLAVQQAVRDVCQVDLPHYFKYVHAKDEEDVQPIMEHLSGLGTDDVRVTVNVPCATGDWFGGWQGDRVPEGHRYASNDARSGRLVNLIKRGQPAIMLCHWQGMYSNGFKAGFKSFQDVVTALHRSFRDETTWMKVSEIGRYWAAKDMTTIKRNGNRLELSSPFGTSGFTIKVSNARGLAPRLQTAGTTTPLKQVDRRHKIATNSWFQDGDNAILCLDLPKQATTIQLA